jgi:hypothetical protein
MRGAIQTRVIIHAYGCAEPASRPGAKPACPQHPRFARGRAVFDGAVVDELVRCVAAPAARESGALIMGKTQKAQRDWSATCSWMILAGMSCVPCLALLTKVLPQYHRTWTVLLVAVAALVFGSLLAYLIPRANARIAVAAEAADDTAQPE